LIYGERERVGISEKRKQKPCSLREKGLVILTAQRLLLKDKEQLFIRGGKQREGENAALYVSLARQKKELSREDRRRKTPGRKKAPLSERRRKSSGD